MVGVMPCGHNDVWQFRARDRGQVFRYCLKCLFDKVGLKVVYVEARKRKKVSIKEELEIGSTEPIKEVKVKKIKVKKSK